MDNIFSQLEINKDRIKRISVVGAGGKTSIIWNLAQEFVKEGKRVAITTTTHMYHPDYMKKNGFEVNWNFAEADNIKKCLEASEDKGCVITGITQFKSGEPYKISAVDNNWLSMLQMYFDVVLVEADGARNLPVKAYHSYEPVIASHSDKIIVVTGMSGAGQKICDVSYNKKRVCEILQKKENDVLCIDDYKKLLIHEKGLLGKLFNFEYTKNHKYNADICAVLNCAFMEKSTYDMQRLISSITQECMKKYNKRINVCLGDFKMNKL